MYIPDFVAIPCAVAAYLQAAPGTSFQFFSGGGQHFDQLPRGGAKYKKPTKFCSQKTQKITIYQNPGEGKMPPLGQMPPLLPLHQMTSLGCTSR